MGEGKVFFWRVIFMSKKILILNGSPRLNGNTAELIKSFTAGAAENGHIVNCVNLQQINIHPCLGCCKGGRDFTSPCVQKDDMDKIYPLYREADIVVFSSPQYYWTKSGQLKCAIDRLFAVAECNENYANPQKESILLMAAEGNDFGETVYWYDHLMNYLHWKSLGKVLCGGVLNVGDIKGNVKLDEAYALGKNI